MRFPPTISPVPTAIAAFIGHTAKSPAGFQRVTSLEEFQRLFGKVSTGSRIALSTLPGYLTESLSLFFLNGGETAYVYSLGPRKAGSAAPFLDALTALEKLPEPALLAFPDAVLLSPAERQKVQLAALAHCAKLRNRFCILDVPAATSLPLQAALTGDNLSYGALYGPWLRTDSTTLPASGAVAGVYASVDRLRGVWKAPANVTLKGITGLTETYTEREQERLNVLRVFPGKGTLVWGARTLDSNSNEWRYVPVRRLFLMVEESLQRGLAGLVFEPNDVNTWLRTRSLIENFLSGLWRQGALVGSKPEQAFFVQVGLNTTMTAQDIAAGRLNIHVGLAPTRLAEFTILRLSFTSTKKS
jgi:uncharacterized protein